MNNADKYSDLHKQCYGGHSLVRSNESNELFVMKILEFYDIKVFEYIRDNRNIHIPRVYDFWEEDGQLTVIEEYISGKTLDQYVKDNPLTRMDKRKIITDILDGLEFLHGASTPIIHRDLKDTNVMVTNDGVVKIIDYDAAKTFKEGETKDTMLVGTAGSAAPEQYGFAQSDPRTDIYGVGMLMRQLFEGDKYYESIMIKATQMDPKQRYQNVKELKRAFKYDVGKDYDILRKPLIITAGVLAGSIFILWGVWFVKYSRRVDADGKVIYINPIQEVFEGLNVEEADDSPQWIEYNGQTYPYSDELLESLSNPEETTATSGGATAVIERSGGNGTVVISITPTPTRAPVRTPTPQPKDYTAILEELNSRNCVWFYSRDQMIDILSEEQHISRSEAAQVIDAQNYDWSDRAVHAAIHRNTLPSYEGSGDYISPKAMKPYLMSLGFTEAQTRAACDPFLFDGYMTYHYGNAFTRYVRQKINGHSCSRLSQLFSYLISEGFTQEFIDTMLSQNSGKRLITDEIFFGYMTDDLGYFGSSATPVPTATPTPVPTPIPTPTTVPETEPTETTEENNNDEENTNAVD